MSEPKQNGKKDEMTAQGQVQVPAAGCLCRTVDHPKSNPGRTFGSVSDLLASFEPFQLLFCSIWSTYLRYTGNKARENNLD